MLSSPLLQRLCCASLLTILTLPAARPVPRLVPDFDEQAKHFRESNNLAKVAADESALEPALDEAFVSIDIGVFDVRYLRSALADPKHFEDLKGIVLGLIDLHVHLLAW